ncbi:hypothetical protein [Kitasatospora purpeofusca]|uniref:hypothetical protein n=1 Tax=Kitasatospora purpeofusca TaxID=67352 RepID=UPI002A5AC56E|nr:hypothetical protein [Kitasatospora purpeofusca]MDY0816195.1 hypothetical protein [Kitasatospora purpeofusca]
MPYEIGAKVKLTRDVAVTADGRAAGPGSPGALSLATGLTGTVTGAAQDSGSAAEALRASFEEQLRGARLDSFAAGLVDGLRQRVIAATAPGTGTGTGYRVRFDNGFILDGLDESSLTPA